MFSVRSVSVNCFRYAVRFQTLDSGAECGLNPRVDDARVELPGEFAPAQPAQV
jgi:hypothetical protein